MLIMKVMHESTVNRGMNIIVADADRNGGMRLDFGILNLGNGEVWDDASDRERALLLIEGSVDFEWEGEHRNATRNSCFDENPTVLHLPAGMSVRLVGRGKSGAELCYEACINKKRFGGTFYGTNSIRNDVFGAGTLNEASIRTVRTVFDGEIAKNSNMVLGEVINHPGKWSSYPPHDHPHPEIYHYRILPEQGFGISLLEDDAYVVRHRSTSLISSNITHSQVAAPGYAMYYLWMIPHLEGDRWLPTTRYFREEHEWLLADGVRIWPDLF